MRKGGLFDAVRVPVSDDGKLSARNSSPRSKPPALLAREWIVVMFGDAVGLLLPALTRSSGRLPLFAVAVLSIVLLHAKGAYRPRLRLSVLDEVPMLLSVTVAASVGVGAGVALWTLPPSVETYVPLVAAAVAGQLAMRALVYAALRTARCRGLLTQACLVYGGGTVGSTLIGTLNQDRRYGLHVVGYVDDEPGGHGVEGAPWLGKSDGLWDLVREHRVGVLLVAFGSGSDEKVVEAMRLNLEPHVNVMLVPRLFEIYVRRGHHDQIGAVPVIPVTRRRRTSLARVGKRGFDMVVSALALILASPMLALAALAVRIEGGPGVLFRQTRIGQDGKPFSLLKLRSMRPSDPAESQTLWNIAQDDRVGPVGRILRKTSIDELPQLWNILRGQMSLVGPRPERPHFVEMFCETYPDYVHRHRVPAGLTGLAQVNGLRGDTSIADRVRYDNYYIDHWSLWMDMKIIAGTVREVLGARGR